MIRESLTRERLLRLVFQEIQGIKERLNVNVELARPEHFVPSLEGSGGRHVFIDTIAPRWTLRSGRSRRA